MQQTSGSVLRERVVVTIRGDDRPGITSSLVRVVAKTNNHVIDIKQTLLHKRLTLSIELSINSANPLEQSVFREFLLEAKRLNVRIDFEITPEKPGSTTMMWLEQLEQQQQQPQQQSQQQDNVASSNTVTRIPSSSSAVLEKKKYVLTLMSEDSIRPKFLADLARLLQTFEMSIDSISKLSESSLKCIEMIVISNSYVEMGDASIKQFRTSLFQFGKEHNVDVAMQRESILRRAKRLVVMDMDSTLIQQEVIDELARHAGVYEKVQEITHRAMGGGIDFNESLRQRVAMLAGCPASAFKDVIQNLVYTEGVELLCRALKKLGYRLAVISGGFTAITDHVKQYLGLDFAYANNLEVGPDGRFTGRTTGPIVNARRKADLLLTIAQQENISTDQVIAIGDGANDLPMLGTAGLGIAFNAKPAVQAVANFRINQKRIDSVLYLLGFTEAEQKLLTK